MNAIRLKYHLLKEVHTLFSSQHFPIIKIFPLLCYCERADKWQSRLFLSQFSSLSKYSLSLTGTKQSENYAYLFSITFNLWYS